MLNGKIKIQKYYKGKEEGVIIFDKFKQNKVYTKINVVIKNVKKASYIICIAKNYDILRLKENDLYSLNYKLLFKCSKEVWEKNLIKDENIPEPEEIIENNYYIEEKEENFINENNNEFI